MSDRLKLEEEIVVDTSATEVFEQLLAQPLEQRTSAERQRVDGIVADGAVATADASASAQAPTPAGIIVGRLVGLADDGRTPVVICPGPSGSAHRARSIVDLHGAHIGRDVVIQFEAGDRSKPIVLGVLQQDGTWPMDRRPDQVEVDADGERIVVTAREQLVLRCGKASVTLTAAGKVIIRGTYVSSQSSGTHRIGGAAIRLN